MLRQGHLSLGWPRPHRRRRAGAALLATVAGLAAAALANHVAARGAERRHPPTGPFVTVNGVRLHYVDRGSGPPVVLLHGNGGMVEDWQASGLLDALARRHRVIALDRPGFGHSDRPRGIPWTARAQARLLLQALRQIGVRRPVLVGHSWGTLVALWMALDDRPAVAGLVLLSGVYFPLPRADVALLSGPALPVLGDVMCHTVSPLIGRLISQPLFRKLFAPGPVDSRFLQGFPTGMALRPSAIRASAEDTAFMIPDAAVLAPRYGELDMPVVIMAGAGDEQVNTSAHSRSLHASIPGSQLIVLDGVGHMIHYAATDRIVEAVDAATH